MIARHHRLASASLLLLCIAAPLRSRAQNSAPPKLLPFIPVPKDPLELVPNGARLVESAEERAATLDLLAKAKRLSDVRVHSYDLKTSFTSYGSSSSDGRWVLEDISPGPDLSRWSAEGPSFSGVFLSVNKLMFSNRPSGPIPLRLVQARDAWWDTYEPEIGPAASLRVADGNLNGAPVRCVLVDRTYGGSGTPFSSGRSFAEAEYCVDPQTGLLETHSPYPGVYVRYDYGNALHFHEQIVPEGFTISEHGKPVIEARTESVSEAPPRTSDLFSTTGLDALGVGQVVVGPFLTRVETSATPNGAGQAAVVRGMLTPDGKAADLEVLASTNES